MRDESLENIIQDLYALDPSLRERDADVRTIVRVLTYAKPIVSIDHQFVSNLRAQLVKPALVPSATLHHSLNWWMIRLIPDRMTQTEVSTEESTFSEVTPFETVVAPSAKRVADVAPETALFTEMANDGGILDSFTVSEQQPGTSVRVDFTTLMMPSFIVIQKNFGGELGEIIGSSALLAGGYTENIDVPLTMSTVRGETYFAVLYQDDGDGVFAKGVDIPLYDATGMTPMFVLFSIADNPTP
jgi:hypothetical protein